MFICMLLETKKISHVIKSLPYICTKLFQFNDVSFVLLSFKEPQGVLIT